MVLAHARSYPGTRTSRESPSDLSLASRCWPRPEHARRPPVTISSHLVADRISNSLVRDKDLVCNAAEGHPLANGRIIVDLAFPGESPLTCSRFIEAHVELLHLSR